MQLHTVRQTAAGAIALPLNNMYLIGLRIGQAATNVPSALSYLYNGSASAIFPAASTAVATSEDGVASYALNHQVDGNTLAAGLFTWTGTLTWVEWQFSDQPNAEGAGLADHRAILFRRTDVGAVTAAIAVNFDVGPAAPKRILAFATPATRGRFQFPATGGAQGQVECTAPRHFRIGPGNASGPIFMMPAPDGIPAAVSLTLTGISDAATTIMAVVYY